MRDDLIARLQPHEWRYLRGIASEATTPGTEIDVEVLRRLLKAIDAFLTAQGETAPFVDTGRGKPVVDFEIPAQGEIAPATAGEIFSDDTGWYPPAGASPLPAAEGLDELLHDLNDESGYCDCDGRDTSVPCEERVCQGRIAARARAAILALRAVAEGRR